jgi:hypothetical protein
VFFRVFEDCRELLCDADAGEVAEIVDPVAKLCGAVGFVPWEDIERLPSESGGVALRKRIDIGGGGLFGEEEVWSIFSIDWESITPEFPQCSTQASACAAGWDGWPQQRCERIAWDTLTAVNNEIETECKEHMGLW